VFRLALLSQNAISPAAEKKNRIATMGGGCGTCTQTVGSLLLLVLRAAARSEARAVLSIILFFLNIFLASVFSLPAFCRSGGGRAQIALGGNTRDRTEEHAKNDGGA
jgi:hypothetical protein